MTELQLRDRQALPSGDVAIASSAEHGTARQSLILPTVLDRLIQLSPVALRCWVFSMTPTFPRLGASRNSGRFMWFPDEQLRTEAFEPGDGARDESSGVNPQFIGDVERIRL
jgi:hypothetical protein